MNVLGFQYAGESSGPLPSWRCFRVDELSGITFNGDLWATENTHSKANTCIVTIHAQVS
jgi:hypothetical protein